MVDISKRENLFDWPEQGLMVMSDGASLSIHHRGCGTQELIGRGSSGRYWECPVCGWGYKTKESTFSRALIHKAYAEKSYKNWLGNWLSVDPVRVGVSIK